MMRRSSWLTLSKIVRRSVEKQSQRAGCPALLASEVRNALAMMRLDMGKCWSRRSVGFPYNLHLALAHAVENRLSERFGLLELAVLLQRLNLQVPAVSRDSAAWSHYGISHHLGGGTRESAGWQECRRHYAKQPAAQDTPHDHVCFQSRQEPIQDLSDRSAHFRHIWHTSHPIPSWGGL